MAHHGHEVAFATGLNLEHAEATLDVVEGDALDRARERLDRRASLDLSRPDHLVHAATQGTTAALAPSTLRTSASSRDARLAPMHGNLVHCLFQCERHLCAQGDRQRGCGRCEQLGAALALGWS